MLAYHFVNAIVTVSHTCYSYCCSTVYNMRQVPDFRIYVYYSSCNYLFFGLILAPLLSLSIFGIFIYTGCQERDGEGKDERMRPKKRKLHELPNTQKSYNLLGLLDSPLEKLY